MALPPPFRSTWGPWGRGQLAGWWVGTRAGATRKPGRAAARSSLAEWLRPLSLPLIQVQRFCSCPHLHSLEASLSQAIRSHCSNSFIRSGRGEALKTRLNEERTRKAAGSPLSSLISFGLSGVHKKMLPSSRPRWLTSDRSTVSHRHIVSLFCSLKVL